AAVDEEGFIRITDRLARFSKIGGEMVPHGKVEDSLQEAAGEAMQVFAVTCIPDEKKGERLAVLHTLGEDVIPGIVDKLSDMGLPNLFIPRANQFVQVKELPLLGTGKLDLRGIKKIAMEAFGVEPEQEGRGAGRISPQESFRDRMESTSCRRPAATAPRTFPCSRSRQGGGVGHGWRG
ncbi:MAG: hypothetical protein MK138_10280, partial [Planctomycetes bacterium]|nr:hypothetical protein [Planctomycetota bacterium]